jgi:hypothetical protein
VCDICFTYTDLLVKKTDCGSLNFLMVWL